MAASILRRQKLLIQLSFFDLNWLQYTTSGVLGESIHVRYYFSNAFLVCFLEYVVGPDMVNCLGEIKKWLNL